MVNAMDLKEITFKLRNGENNDRKVGKKVPSATKPKLCLTRSLSAGSNTRYPLLSEGDVQVCSINHHSSLLQKIMNSRLLRRWESHHLTLGDSNFYSSTPKGYMQYGVSYSSIQDVISVQNSGTGLSYCIHLILPASGSMLLQTANSYTRDQWYHSLIWKITAVRFKKLFHKITKPEMLISELKDLVLFCMSTPISDQIIYQLPLNTVSTLLLHHDHEMNDSMRGSLVQIIAPVLEITSLTPSICKCFQRISRVHSAVDVTESFITSVQRVLKHNTDFGKLPYLRLFVQDFLCAVYNRENSIEDIAKVIIGLHSSNAVCPHQRVLPNLVTVSLGAVYSVFEDENSLKAEEKKKMLDCFKCVFMCLTTYSDWLPLLAVLLQAVPFPKSALKDRSFASFLTGIIKVFTEDKRCEVHQCLLPIRDEKPGWVQIFGPGGDCCQDDGDIFAFMMMHLVPCCCKRKKMLVNLKNSLRSLFILMAIRGNVQSIEVLIALLDFELISDEDENLEIVSALLSSIEGRQHYEELCSKRKKFIQMKLADGPHKLTLPPQSTDDDLIHLLQSGSFGNLKGLNLAFTRILSALAKYIIQLPSLMHLNLWATPFDDTGLLLISEHMRGLESLNLCETMITDEGLRALSFLENLRILNLNSTKLLALTYEHLK